MVAVTADKVIVELVARVDKAERDIKRHANTTAREMERVERSSAQAARRQEMEFKRAAQSIRREQGQIADSLKGMAAALASAFGAAQLVQLADRFTQLQNQLRVSGLEGENLARVQSQLMELSGRYGVSINELANLYGKASQAGVELGASEAQLLQVTEAASQALKITGTSAVQAQGALLGLAQALSSGTVRAEEFNQINEGGLRPLLQAAANSERFGGSVAKLRQAMLDGKVTSQEFFQGILNGSAELESKASKATLTIAGAFEALNSQLVVYFGEAGQASGATAALAAAIQKLADNLDIIIPAIGVIAVVAFGRFAAGALAGGTALKSLAAYASIATTSLAGTALAARGAGAALLAAFGGPVGLAISAIVLALGAAVYEAQRYDGVSRKLKQSGEGVASGANTAKEAIDRLASSYGKARVEAEALARAQLQLSNVRLANARREYAEQGQKSLEEEMRGRKLRQSAVGRNLLGPNAATGAPSGVNADMRKATANLAREMRTNQELIDALKAPPASKPSGGGVGKPSGGRRGGAAPKAPKAAEETIADFEDATRRAIDAIDQATRNRFDTATAANENEQDLLRASMALTSNRQERNALEARILRLQHSQEAAEQELVLNSLTSTETEKQIAAARLAILEKLQAQDAELLRRDQQGPLEQYIQRNREQLENWDDTVGSMAVDGIEAFSSGIADAIVNAKSLGDVFQNVAKQIIADLVQIAIKMAIFEGLKALGLPGFSAGGSFGVPGFAAGGAMRIGGRPGTDNNVLSMNGAPMARVSMGETVEVKPAGRGGGGSGQAPIYVDARGAVMNDQFAQMILTQARTMDQQAGAAVYKKAVADAPSSVAMANRYGG